MCDLCDRHASMLLSRRAALFGAGAAFALSTIPYARAEQPASTGPAPNAIAPRS